MFSIDSSIITKAQSFVNPQDSTNAADATARSMAHHKDPVAPFSKIVVKSRVSGVRYGVPQSPRILPPGLFIKKFDEIRDFLAGPLDLSCAQREVVLRLLRFSSHYRGVYPKATTVCSEPGCSKRTFWRVMRKLQDSGLVQVSNRYVIREHAQISNLYRFHKLLILLVRYLAEHGQKFWEKWLQPWLGMSGKDFWGNFAFRGGLDGLPAP